MQRIRVLSLEINRTEQTLVKKIRWLPPIDPIASIQTIIGCTSIDAHSLVIDDCCYTVYFQQEKHDDEGLAIPTFLLDGQTPSLLSGNLVFVRMDDNKPTGLHNDDILRLSRYTESNFYTLQAHLQNIAE